MRRSHKQYQKALKPDTPDEYMNQIRAKRCLEITLTLQLKHHSFLRCHNQQMPDSLTRNQFSTLAKKAGSVMN